LEEALKSIGLWYGIVRPTLVYGEADVLINNIAWVLRHFPIFAIPGDGAYRLQPGARRRRGGDRRHRRPYPR
jgi:NADH dehydrogenase